MDDKSKTLINLIHSNKLLLNKGISDDLFELWLFVNKAAIQPIPQKVIDETRRKKYVVERKMRDDLRIELNSKITNK